MCVRPTNSFEQNFAEWAPKHQRRAQPPRMLSGSVVEVQLAPGTRFCLRKILLLINDRNTARGQDGRPFGINPADRTHARGVTHQVQRLAFMVRNAVQPNRVSSVLPGVVFCLLFVFVLFLRKGKAPQSLRTAPLPHNRAVVWSADGVWITHSLVPATPRTLRTSSSWSRNLRERLAICFI